MAAVSASYKTQRRRAAALERSREESRAPAKPKPRVVSAYEHRKSGLEWLRDKGKLSPDQFKAGLRYGELYRIASMEGDALLKSCLAEPERVGGGGGVGLTRVLPMEYLAQARAGIAAARAALLYQMGMIAALDLICGRGFTPTEALGPEATSREVSEAVTGLQLALDQLAAFWRQSARQPAAA